ncbi:MAG: MBOAT family protein [Lachnospiraceae bacterium]|nr:MBOAT family protein [Lachnospiraceae bacterium]
MAIYTNLYLLVFLPLVLILYQIIPQKHRWKILLCASYIMYFTFSKKLVLLLIGTAVFTHYISIWMEWIDIRSKQEQAEASDRKQKTEIKKGYQARKKGVLALGVLVLLGILFYVQYYNFFAENINKLAAHFSAAALPILDIAFPMGISFYTLEAIGYLADVYWNRIPAEKHLGKLALFLSFFPQIMEGPIARYSDTADQLYEGKPLNMGDLNAGFERILWGLFKKMIVSDRLATLTGELFNNYKDYHGVMIAVAAVTYTIQLYMEFSGSIDIVIGSGRLFGVKLPENFNQPFSAQSAAEFWRRWHMSLGTWFKNYLFYPVTVSAPVKKWNRYARKRYGKYVSMLGASAMALFPVWIATGLWHGAEWKYIFYGLYYFVILFIGVALEPFKEKRNQVLHIDPNAPWFKALRILKTWLIIFTGELFFNARGLKAGFIMFRNLFVDFHISDLWNGSFPETSLHTADYLAIAGGCIVVWIVGFLREHKVDLREKILSSRLPLKWAAYYALILAILIFGAYGAGYQAVDLIYAGF